MADQNYKDLRDALAAGPTPGPWDSGADPCQNNEKALAICKENIDAHTAPSSGYFYVIFLPDGRRVALVGHGPDGRANAEYIKSAQPETIRVLLSERDGLMAQHHTDSKTLRKYAKQRDDLRKERDVLRASITEYLQAQDAVDNNEYQSTPEEFGKLNARRRAVRDDLDAALAQHQGEKHDTNTGI